MSADMTSAGLTAYVATGPEILCYGLDRQTGALTSRGAVTMPSRVQYAVPDSSASRLYVVTSDRQKGSAPMGSRHRLVALAIDRQTGALRPHGPERELPFRPIHLTIDAQDRHLLVAFSDPADLRVWRIEQDGTLGGDVAQEVPTETGIYPHQVRMVPGKDQVILVTRGNHATAEKPEDPGALKVYPYKNGQLGPAATVAPNGGYGFGPRHLDFHPTKGWVYVSLELQNLLQMFAFDGDRLSAAPVFSVQTLADPSQTRKRQLTSGIRVHPNGGSVFIVNRADGMAEHDGEQAFAGGENNIAIYRIDPATGAPALLAHVETNGIHCRNVQFDRTGEVFVGSHIKPYLVPDGDGLRLVPPRLSVFRTDADGHARLLQSHDIPAQGHEVFWMGLVDV